MAKYRLGCNIPGGLLVGDSVLARLRHACKGLQDYGFDYAEANIGLILDLSEEEMAAAEKDRLPIEACNCFIPADMKIVGASYEPGSPLYARAEKIMQRMSRLGIGILVFGSGPARRIPDGVAIADGLCDIGNFLWMCGGLAEQYGIKLLIEPLCPGECNGINLTCEAAAMAAMVNRPAVSYLADSYHMAGSGEAPDALEQATVLPLHVHVAEAGCRRHPGAGEDDYVVAFAASLRRTAYAGRVTVECNLGDEKTELPKTVAFLQEHF